MIYEYKGNKYQVYKGISNSLLNLQDTSSIQFKTPEGDWIDVVIYSPLLTWVNDTTDETYTSMDWKKQYIRSKEDFLSKFTKVEEPENEVLQD